MTTDSPSGFWKRIAPALTLILLAPAIAEVLPGATRMSAMFVFPIEMGVWGGGALLIRAAVRHWRLGWRNMLFLALALSVAEECIIQQTSLAPLVVQIVKGPPYARDFGVNWVYLLWALAYESVLVVFVPVALTELIFRNRRQEPWANRTGAAVTGVYFAIASFFAWFTWTRIARPKVFHLPAYDPPVAATAIALVAIFLLVFAAIGPLRGAFAKPSRPLPIPPVWLAGAVAFVVAVLWYGLVLLAFRIRPEFPPAVAAAAGMLVALAVLFAYPRWSANARWSDAHRFWTVFSAMLGSMASGFIGFIGATPLDLYGKTILDIAAIVLMFVLALRLRRPLV